MPSTGCDHLIRETSSTELVYIKHIPTRQEASGLNLHGARHMIILHPYVSPFIQAADLVPLSEAQAFERQAVGRIHRFPQSSPVTVHLFYARGTVEEELYSVWGLLNYQLEEERETGEAMNR